ncbi:MAG: hypothetical protein WCA49_19760, partial [Candidatus Sulfotelmatobacter sp.]
RTPHQPEKFKKLSKNDLLVLLLTFESMKRARLYLVYFQSSAARPQAGDRILCSGPSHFVQTAHGVETFGGQTGAARLIAGLTGGCEAVNIL